MKNMYGETVKPQYEVALKQHVKGDVGNDYETVDFIGAYSYKKACETAKVQSKNIGKDIAQSFKTLVGGELKAYNENKQKQNDANIQKTLSLLKTENIKLKLEIDQLTEEHSKLMLKLKEGNSSVKQSGDEITALIQKHFKISSVTEQEIINLSNKLSKYKLEIKESNDLIDHDKLVIDHLSEEISKLKKSKAKLEQDKQKIKQESLLLKKSMLEMKSKSDREYEMVTSSLMKLSNKFKALKAEMYNSKIN